MEEDHNSLIHRRWVFFIVAMLVTMVDLGFVLSLGAIFVDMIDMFNTNRTSIALVQSLLIFTTGFGSVAGILISNYGLRKSSFLGSLLSSIGMSLGFFASSVWHLYITLSITGLVLYEGDLLNPEMEGERRIYVLFHFCRTLYYFSTVTLFAAQSLSTLAIGGYSIGITVQFICALVSIGFAFDGRAKINALTMQFSCIGIGAAVYPYLLRYLTSTYGINGMFLILGGVFLNNFAASLLFPRRRGTTVSDNVENEASSNKNDYHPNVRVFKRLWIYIKTEVLSIITVPYILTLIATALGQSLADGFTTVYIDIYLWKTFTDEQATCSMIVYQISNTIVRILSGFVMQVKRMDSFAIPIVCSLCGCVGVVTIYVSMGYMIAYVGSGLIGMSSAGFVAGSGIIVAELLPKEKFGFAFGLVISSIAILSTGTGPLYGAIRDHTQTYVSVFLILGVTYVTSTCLFLIAFIVRRSNMHPEAHTCHTEQT